MLLLTPLNCFVDIDALMATKISDNGAIGKNGNCKKGALFSPINIDK